MDAVCRATGVGRASRPPPDPWKGAAIFVRVVDFCWFCFKWGLVFGLVALAVAVPQLYHRVDEEIRSRAEAQLAKLYPHLKPAVRAAELVQGEGIKLRDVTIVEPTAEGPHPELLHIEEVVLGCQTTLLDLAQHEPEITHVLIRRPMFRATRRPDNSWSITKLLVKPQLNKRLPDEIRIEDGTIEIFDPLKNPSSTLPLRDLNVRLAPVQAEPPLLDVVAAWRVQGTVSGDYLRRCEFEGQIDPARASWTLTGGAEGLTASPELYAMLPDPLPERLKPLARVRGETNFNFRVSYDPALGDACQFQAAGHIVGGRVDDPQLPHPLTDLRANFRLANEGLAVDALFAHSNQASLQLSYRQSGFEPDCPKLVEAEVRQLELDRRLLDVLPDSLQEQWYKYRPSGQVDLDAKLRFDGVTWRPEITLRCLNVSFTYHKFPYRVDDGKGTVTLKDDLLRLNLMAYSGNEPIRMEGELTGALTQPKGWFEARGDAVQLDSKLMAALSENARAVVQSLNPRGALGFYAKVWRDGPDQPTHKHLILAANHCSVQYEKFPYPLRNIRGRLEMFDDSWTFSNLEGTNNTSTVVCNGALTPSLQGNELQLHFTGQNVPLDDELRDALRPNEKQAWMQFRPRGTMDLEADVRYLSESKQLGVGVRAWPHPETASIEPVHFPYRFEKLCGELRYENGHVEFTRVKAQHGPVQLATAGSCDFFPDGRWRFRLEGLTVDRLQMDRDLIQALPERLRKVLVELRPTKPVNLRGVFELESSDVAGDPMHSRWDLQVGLLQGSIDAGVKLENICGSMQLVGGFDGHNFQSRGELAIDSLCFKDCQFTEVRGPMWIDDQQILLGSWVARRQNAAALRQTDMPAEQARALTAKLFGGTVYGEARVSVAPEIRYDLHGELVGANLTQIAQELAAAKQGLRGNVFAAIDLRGLGRSTNAMGGHGTIQLRDADIYELPVMISLLKILSIRAPDRNAFSRSDINFRIEGEHFYFDQIDFNGDAISLLGKGEMDFQQNIKLNFYSTVGRSDLQIPVVKELFSTAGKQIMTIHVGGTLQNPEPRREAFPGVNQAIQTLQGDRPGDESSEGPMTARRRYDDSSTAGRPR